LTLLNEAQVLYSKVLLGDDPKGAIMAAPMDVIHTLCTTLAHSGLVEESELPPIPEANAPRDAAIAFIQAFTKSALPEETPHSLVVKDLEKLSGESYTTLMQTVGQDTHWYDAKGVHWGSEIRFIKRINPFVENLPEDRKHWLSTTQFIKQGARRDNSSLETDKVSLLLFMMLKNGDSDSYYEIDGTRYRPDDLFGLYLNKTNYSYFINPVAVPMLLDALGLAPMLADTQKWLSATDMALKIYGQSDEETIGNLGYLAKHLLKDPEAEIPIATGEVKDTRKCKDMAGIYRKHGTPATTFFNSDAEQYFAHWLGVARGMPEGREKEVNEYELGEAAGLTRNQTRLVVKEIARRFMQQGGVDVLIPGQDSATHYLPGEAVLRVLSKDGKARYYIRPDVAAAHFKPEQMREVAKNISGQEVKTIRPKGSLSLHQVKRKIGITAKEDHDALDRWVEELHEEGHWGVSFSPSTAASGQETYYVQEDLVGPEKLINRPAVRERAGTQQRLPLAPKGWLSATAVRNATGISSSEDFAALNEWLKRLHAEKHEAVGEYSVGMTNNRTTIFVNPDYVGLDKLINRFSIRAFKERIIREENWKPPEKKKSTARSE
jgi:hypothetical protein